MVAKLDWRRKYGVYFIHDGDGHVKIGHAHDPQQRLKALQTANRRAFTLLAVAVGEPMAQEAEYHRAFVHLHTQGEWVQDERGPGCRDIAGAT